MLVLPLVRGLAGFRRTPFLRMRLPAGAV